MKDSFFALKASAIAVLMVCSIVIAVVVAQRPAQQPAAASEAPRQQDPVASQ